MYQLHEFGVAGLSLVVAEVILLWGVNNWFLLVILIGMSLNYFLMKRNKFFVNVLEIQPSFRSVLAVFSKSTVCLLKD